MGETFSKPKRLTPEQARIVSEEFLWKTKVAMRDSFKLIEEGIWNDDKELTNAKSTTILLGKEGENFFLGYIENRERYQRLIDVYVYFIFRIEVKMRQLGLVK